MYPISPLDISHLKEIVLLESICFNQAWSIRQYRDFLNRDSSRVLGISKHGGLKAYIAFQILLDEAEIINLGVHPECRNAGMGKSLVAKALDTCRRAGVKTVFLEVRSSNIPALHIYHGLGFTSKGCRKAYYQDNLEDAMVLGIDLELPPALKYQPEKT